MLKSAVSALVRRFHREESGQVLVLTVVLLTVLGGMVAFAVDLGGLMAQRRDLQNAADAIALAASLELPDQSEALAVANQWAANNDIDLSDMTVTFTAQNLPSEPNPKVHVQLTDQHGFIFAPLIGITSAAVGAGAEAIKTSPAGGSGMVPLAVTEDAVAGACCGDLVTIKYDASPNGFSQGNAGPVMIDGPGVGNCTTTQNFCMGVINGSESTVCAYETDGTYCEGDTVVQTQTGNLQGATKDAITCLITDLGDPDRKESVCNGVYTGEPCNEFGEVLYDDPLSDDPDVLRITSECNTFLPGVTGSAQLIVVPVICTELPDGSCEGNFDSCTGSCDVRIVEFALFFLEGFGSGNCNTGNDCEIVGRFVKVNQNVGLLAGIFNPQALNQFVRLVQ